MHKPVNYLCRRFEITDTAVLSMIRLSIKQKREHRLNFISDLFFLKELLIYYNDTTIAVPIYPIK